MREGEKKKKSCGELSPSTFQDSNHIQSSLTNPNTWREKKNKTHTSDWKFEKRLTGLHKAGAGDGINESTCNKKLS